MYRNPHQLSRIGLPLRTFKSKVGTSSRRPVGLSENLTQALQKNLYLGLYQRGRCRPRASADSIHVSGSIQSDSSQSSVSSVFVRNVCMLADESIRHTFSPESGLIPVPLPRGRMLLLTNRRIIVFGQQSGVTETVLVPLEEVKAVAVKAGQRSKGALFQGGMMIVAAVAFYVILAYWLTGRIDGPQVPIIRMDLVAFVAFLAVLTGVAVLAQMYFARPDGEVVFQGDGVKCTFSFKGEKSEDEMYVLVNAAFSARQQIMG